MSSYYRLGRLGGKVRLILTRPLRTQRANYHLPLRQVVLTSVDREEMEEKVYVTKQDQGPITARDVKQIFPTAVILLITLVICVTVIPYAFSEVIKYETI